MVSLRLLSERFPALCTASAVREVGLEKLARRLAGELRQLRMETVAFRTGEVCPQEFLALFAPQRRLAVLNGAAEYRDWLHAAAVRLARPVMGMRAGLPLAALDGELAKWKDDPLVAGGSGALAFVRDVLGGGADAGVEAPLEEPLRWRGMTIAEFIAAGSTSRVYRVGCAGGEYALKVPRPGAGERFRRELEVLLRFEHPNLPKPREWSLDGELYCVMDLYRTGRAVGGWASCGKALFGALEYVHGSGMVHGDIRRCNLGIDRSGAPVLLDFSHARTAASPEESAAECEKLKRLLA